MSCHNWTVTCTLWRVFICTPPGWQAWCGVTGLTCSWHMTQTQWFLPHVRSDHFMTHLQVPQWRRGRCKASLTVAFMLSRAALLEVCTAHGMAQRLWGCCISITKPDQTPVSKLCNGDKRASLALLCNSTLAMTSLIQLPKANERNHTGCDTEAQDNHHTIKIHCRNQHLHWWAWCTAMKVIFLPLSILALSIFS